MSKFSDIIYDRAHKDAVSLFIGILGQVFNGYHSFDISGSNLYDGYSFEMNENYTEHDVRICIKLLELNGFNVKVKEQDSKLKGFSITWKK